MKKNLNIVKWTLSNTSYISVLVCHDEIFKSFTKIQAAKVTNIPLRVNCLELYFQIRVEVQTFYLPNMFELRLIIQRMAGLTVIISYLILLDC